MNMDFRAFLSKSGIILATQICILTLLIFFFFNITVGKQTSVPIKPKKKKKKSIKFPITP